MFPQKSMRFSLYVIASVLCEAISSLKHEIALTEESRLAMTWFILKIAAKNQCLSWQ